MTTVGNVKLLLSRLPEPERFLFPLEDSDGQEARSFVSKPDHVLSDEFVVMSAGHI